MPIGPILRAMKHNRTRFALIILEIAITLAIVTNAVNMILVEREKMLQRSGFDDENILSVRVDPFALEFLEQGYVENVVRADIRALQAIPGVKGASATSFLPWMGGGSSAHFRVDGSDGRAPAQMYPATRGIFDALGIKVSQGRAFVESDTPVDPNTPTSVAIISRAYAKKIFGDANPVGRVLTADVNGQQRTVIGVIDDFYAPYGGALDEVVVFTPGRSYGPGGWSFLVRVEPGAMKSVAAQLEPALLKVNPGRTFLTKTILETRDAYFSNGTLVVRGMTAVIIILVFITALGILGITSLAVSERTRQIGTRRALGATRGDILKHFLTENWIVTTIGLMLGIIAAYALNLLLVAQLTDTKLPWSLVATGMVLLWINGLIATIPPALRAATVSPAIATRSV